MFKTILHRALLKWGNKSQLDMAKEELAELIVVLCKLNRGFNGADMHDLAEEMADVEVMLEQIKLMYITEDLDELINKAKEIKLKRLEKLIS